MTELLLLLDLYSQARLAYGWALDLMLGLTGYVMLGLLFDAYRDYRLRAKEQRLQAWEDALKNTTKYHWERN
jgi:hypothetical protein